jgi:hypothetical protein
MVEFTKIIDLNLTLILILTEKRVNCMDILNKLLGQFAAKLILKHNYLVLLYPCALHKLIVVCGG